ncbi:hypothetical protein B0H67DRAFT_572307 [Lasiosphaeris hirsuta]|uniref:Zn(2)-C6 fungal-type domain-containing protein n=1 Tax=Lasiosphaeris hirsuta TaxID=260670 RepID=A0AA40B1R9_9PEZI|nr:hypothetical protein B0H67DRAFT_572307 [Lasiosphaeris hirsuta]
MTTEPHATPDESREAAAPAGLGMLSSTPAAALACYACKRRKVKCDRQLPSCSPCHKLNVVCEYPTEPGKPGPKTGFIRGTKRRRLDHSPNSRSSDRDISLSTAGQAASFDRARRNSAVSSSCYSTTHHGSLPPPVASVQPPGRPTSAPTFSRIMYPSHEAQTRPQTPSNLDATLHSHQDGAVGINISSVCAALKISRATYDMLMDSYFTNMTSFSLFQPGSIEPKFAMMRHHSDAEALVAAMFSFSARHCLNTAADPASDCPSPSDFAQVASSQLDKSVDRYGDMPPPFWLLQAGILVTFYQLTQSVRSRSWKKLGDCIRYAYDTNLHIVDANHEPASARERGTVNTRRWALLEERRRAWWAVWEMDVFASTIRRLPTAIDSSLNLTMLPVPDSCWFSETYQESCFLDKDCNLRWKHLSQSGNQSAKAWFVVVNSLMRNTQRIVYPAGSAVHSLHDKHAEKTHDDLAIMANCLHCTITSLPTHLTYRGEPLDFQARAPAAPRDAPSPRQDHADRYAIHLMTQLCRFMIYHHKICARAPWLAQHKPPSTTSPSSTPPSAAPQGDADADANAEWAHYMAASDAIVTVVRSSARDHHRFVNPFLVNTLWFAAAAQCAGRVFGPAALNRRLMRSRVDVLELAVDRFVAFWGGMESLKGKLARIETRLQSLVARPAAGEERVAPVLVAANEGVVEGPGGIQGHGMVLVGPGGQAGWADPKVASYFVPDLDDFTQQFALTGQTLYAAGSMDFSPFGMEELLMTGLDTQP